ncbi:MAG TPA: PQQ-dependent sugar dehydrogenase [Nitrospiraceae bacterium]|nr:PQQ-dependent sugar dehydrogenase [Nitrospiraceae bacterium]
MLPIRRLLMAGLAIVGIGCLVGCSDKRSDQDSLAPLPQSNSLRLQQITANLSSPVFMTAPANDTSRLFIVEQGGLIRIFDVTTGSLLATPFLDINGLTSLGGEEGLLGMAFDPQYAVNRQFYVFYTNNAGNIVIARYLRNATNANLADSLAATILTVPHPNFSNHNGGMLAFGPDGCLYAGVGDGGSGGDPNNNGQSLSSLLGKILRLDPDGTGGPCSNGIINPFILVGGAPQIWSRGLRNPWRFSFDRDTDDLYIGDVGQGAREEINVSPAPNAGRGLNYGWRLMEGFLCFNPSMNCNSGGLTLPVLDYPHLSGACSVTGGYVYRGSAKPDLRGTYFYADFCAGFVRSFRYQNGQPTEQTEWPLLSPPGGSVTSFGEDAEGELYVMTQGGGLFKFIPN